MLKLKTKYKLQWIFTLCLFISSVENITGQVTLACNSGFPSFHETKPISNSVVNCTLTGGTSLKIKTESPSSSFNVAPLDNPGDYGVYFKYEPDFETLSIYYITLEGTDGSVSSSDVDLTVTIVDDDDNPPKFALSSFTIPVDENTIPESVTQLIVTDADGSTSYDYTTISLSFTGTNGDYDGTFVLSKVTYDNANKQAVAQLTLSKELDYENMVSYSLTIEAIDGGGVTADASIVVNVVDVEDTAPYFTQIATYTQIKEDSPIDFVVFTVTAVDGDRGIDHGVTYAITGGDDNGDFKIDPDRGVVSVNKALDREVISLYVLNIMATEKDSTDTSIPYQSSTSATVSLDDVNDCTPQFTETTYNASVPEKSPAGFLVTFELDQSFVCSDQDTETYATFDVTLDDPQKIFKISPTSGVSQQTFTIMVDDPTNLDYETTETVTATVTAVDSDNPSLTSSSTITINILDVNDDYPTISAVNCDDTPENVASKTVVCTVDASNPDPQFATLKYSGNFGQLEGIVDIDPTSGDISVTADDVFDYEYVKSYSFTVIVTNDNGVGLSFSKAAQLNIVDVNDNNPIFQPDTYKVTLNEGDADFAVPLVVQASDLDSDVNADLVFTITDGSEYFSLGSASTSGKMYSQTIVPIAPLDFESIDGCTSASGCPINVIVEATDKGSPALTGTATVTVQLMDINDNAPEFDNPTYSGSVKETDPEGTAVLTVAASDHDATSKYNTFTYRLENDGAANFVIDKTSGEITVATSARLNPNLYSPIKYSYNLTVYANDGAHETPCEVDVTVNDVDNNPPVFEAKTYSTNLKENDTDYITTPFYTVQAIDIDQNPVLVYSIDFSKSTAQDKIGNTVTVDLSTYFTIDGASGALTIVQAVDREFFNTVELALVVTDTNTEDGADSDTASIYIQIDDVNDCEPAFQNAPYQAVVPEMSPSTIVQMSSQTQVLATDGDLDFNQVTYSIDDTTDFEIGLTTGVISTSSGSTIDYENTKYVIVTITAKDNGDPALSSDTTVNITIKDVNDNPPVIDSNNNFQFNEEATGVVGTVHASDKDSGSYGTVCYSIDWTKSPEYQDLFSIGSASGSLSVIQAIDFDTESISSYVLQIVAKDNCDEGGVDQLEDQDQATITILPVNDFHPVIAPILECQTVTEDSPPGTVIVTVTATDSDKSPDGAPFTFTLEDDSGHFQIDSTLGRVSLVDNVTDVIQSFDVTVTVCDASPTPLCSNETFCIEVTDVNNHSPRITSNDLTDPIAAWNCTAMEDIAFTVYWTDDDTLPENQASTFEISSKCTDNADPDANVAFKLGQEVDFSVEILINDNLDVTKCTKYEVTVTVTNTNDNSKTTTTPIEVEVVSCDFTNSDPIFNGTRNENVQWSEDCTLRSSCDPYAYSLPVDLDIPDEDIPIYCYITDGNIDETFTISYNSCVVSVAKELDYETHKDYQLTLFASENEDPPTITIPYDVKNRSLAVLVVTVQDVNDQAPYFDPDPFYSGVSSTNKLGDVITTLTAKDNDTVDAGQLTFAMDSDVTINNVAKMEGVPTDCILLSSNGDITLNYAFTDSMTGNIQFVASVTDSGGRHHNYTDVNIYVVSSAEKLVCYASKTPNDFQDVYRGFENDFSNATGYNVVVDSIDTHTDAQDNPIPSQCEVVIHMADKSNNILSADDAMQVVNEHNEVLYSVVFINYDVFQIKPYLQTPVEPANNIEDYILIAVAAVLLVLSIALIIMSIYNSRRMKRKLKAATAPAFVSQNSGINKIGVPNSNLHAIEGSNPIWNQKSNVEQGLNFDETSDNVSMTNSLGVRNDEKFEGGLNNPTFEQRIENFFNEDNYRNSDARSLNSEKFDFGDDEPFDYQDRNSVRSRRDSVRSERESVRSERDFIGADRDSVNRPMSELMDL